MKTSQQNDAATLPALPIGKAEQIARDPERAVQLAESVERKARRHRGALGQTVDDVLALARMLRNYARRRYTNVPWKSIAMVSAALFYFLAPIDMIPDFLFGGFVDDVGLLLAVIRQVKSDVDAYKSWEKERAQADEA
ncbi:MAG: DUF1232 domain-containing protein [Candidatus Hydrogenedentes bacterium]|nr:DUF1232 domain-containing protein [Candidatus Hydrogenedentota bacterium]